LVSRNKSIQLSEFGLRLALGPNFCPDRQHLPTTAPEAVTGESTMTSDLWALGFVLYQLCTLFSPSKKPVFQAQKSAKYSPLMKDLTERLLSPNPSDRLTTGEILNFPIIREHLPWLAQLFGGTSTPKPAAKPAMMNGKKDSFLGWAEMEEPAFAPGLHPIVDPELGSVKVQT
jgi:serine/threonine protein kinase